MKVTIREVAREARYTAGAPVSLRLTPDRRTIAADGYDLSYVTVEALDADGRVVPTATDMLHFSVEGAGELFGVDNGNAEMRFRLNGMRAITIALVVIVSLVIAATITLILWPLAAYTSQIAQDEPLVPKGASELRYLADAYNAIYTPFCSWTWTTSRASTIRTDTSWVTPSFARRLPQSSTASATPTIPVALAATSLPSS